jgi:hypothetical protein
MFNTNEKVQEKAPKQPLIKKIAAIKVSAMKQPIFAIVDTSLAISIISNETLLHYNEKVFNT